MTSVHTSENVSPFFHITILHVIVIVYSHILFIWKYGAHYMANYILTKKTKSSTVLFVVVEKAECYLCLTGCLWEQPNNTEYKCHQIHAYLFIRL